MNADAFRPGLALQRARVIAKTAAVWLLIATLAWSPFPLGGAIAWAAGVQEILIAACWMLWVIGTFGSRDERLSSNRAIAVPLVLVVLALGWAVVQIMPVVPQSWVHPVWGMASDALGRPTRGVISLNPWQTEAEILKLASTVMAGWLAFRMGRRVETARLLLNAVITIGAAYALYAFILEFAGTRQTALLYSVPWHSALISGPFMLHNSFATYAGMASIAAVARLFATGSEAIIVGRGWRRLAESVLSHCFGRGAFLLVAALLTFAGVVASASRAGFAATMCGLAAIAMVSFFVVRNRSSRAWATVGAVAAVAPLLILITFNGDTLDSRISQLLASDTGDQIRFSLWAATQRMISDAPWLGLGLGSFEDAYPLYASQSFPFVMDKAHCDYLEFAAGIGLPAAIAWWAALAWLIALCVRGVRDRRRNRAYSIIAIGASVLVAVHSSVDFSLQLPAVALLYAVLTGVGAAQSQTTRSLHQNP
jgi:O-antigen ligase